jgi:hypothetical protein
MGSDEVTAKLMAFLSNHNSPSDDQDRAAWNNLMDQIEHLVDSPRFAWLQVHRELPRMPVIGWGFREKIEPPPTTEGCAQRPTGHVRLCVACHTAISDSEIFCACRCRACLSGMVPNGGAFHLKCCPWHSGADRRTSPLEHPERQP